MGEDIFRVMLASMMIVAACCLGYLSYSGFVSGEVGLLSRYGLRSYASGFFAYFVSDSYLLFAVALLFASIELLSFNIFNAHKSSILMRWFKILTVLSAVIFVIGLTIELGA